MRWTRRSLGALAAVAAGSLAVAVASGTGAVTAGAAGSISFAELWDFTGVGSGPTPYANASILSAEYDINAAGGVLGEHVNNVADRHQERPRRRRARARSRAGCQPHRGRAGSEHAPGRSARSDPPARARSSRCADVATPSSTAPPIRISGASSRPIRSAARRWRSTRSSSTSRAWRPSSELTPAPRAIYPAFSAESRRRNSSSWRTSA